MRILITGANRGLGLALVHAAVKRGHDVIAGVRDVRQGIESLSRLKNGHPQQITVVPLDVSNEDSVILAAKTVQESFPALDALINNAGILLGRGRSIEETYFNEVRQTFEINLFGAMRVVKHFLPLLSKGMKPVILNISSEAGSMTNAYGGDYPYALSKAALNMFSQQLSRYLQDQDFLVYAVHPGWMRTDMGGEKAPLDPRVSAEGILDLAERRKEVTGRYVFVDYLGNPMPI